MNTQYLRSLQALHMVRTFEAKLGLASIAHLRRHPAANRPTPPKLHKITDRGARKAAARQLTVELIRQGTTVIRMGATV